jgi:hypothetical protein
VQREREREREKERKREREREREKERERERERERVSEDEDEEEEGVRVHESSLKGTGAKTSRERSLQANGHNLIQQLRWIWIFIALQRCPTFALAQANGCFSKHS